MKTPPSFGKPGGPMFGGGLGFVAMVLLALLIVVKIFGGVF